MGVGKDDFILCVCHRCGFVTYGLSNVAEDYMRQHLVKKHGIRGYTTIPPWRQYYTRIVLPPYVVEKILSDREYRRRLFRSLRETVKRGLGLGKYRKRA